RFAPRHGHRRPRRPPGRGTGGVGFRAFAGRELRPHRRGPGADEGRARCGDRRRPGPGRGRQPRRAGPRCGRSCRARRRGARVEGRGVPARAPGGRHFGQARDALGGEPGRRHRGQQATTLPRFLFALGIPHLGETTAKSLAQWLGSLQFVRSTPAVLLQALPDIGGEVARSIATFFEQPGNVEAVDGLLAAGIAFSDESPPSAALRDRLGLAHLLGTLPVDKLGGKSAERLAGTYGTLDALLRANASGWTGAGLSAAGAENLAAHLADDAALAALREADASMCKLLDAAPVRIEHTAGPLEGRTVVLTGSL